MSNVFIICAQRIGFTVLCVQLFRSDELSDNGVNFQRYVGNLRILSINFNFIMSFRFSCNWSLVRHFDTLLVTLLNDIYFYRGCFDEFNRIEIEVLSVVASQVRCILDAISYFSIPANRPLQYQSLPSGNPPMKVGTFNFFDDQISLIPTVGLFITMNPG